MSRVSRCLSPRPNLDPPPPSRKRVRPSPPNQRGGTHSPAVEGVGRSQFGRLEKKPSTLSKLCGLQHLTTEKIQQQKMTKWEIKWRQHLLILLFYSKWKTKWMHLNISLSPQENQMAAICTFFFLHMETKWRPSAHFSFSTWKQNGGHLHGLPGSVRESRLDQISVLGLLQLQHTLYRASCTTP